MARGGKPFSVDTEPTKEVVVDSLTRDATVRACIFDLIDNSIDAARDTIFQSASAQAKQALPDSYAGYEIKLTFSGDGLRIEDNCGGIPVDALKTMVLRFGKPSAHSMGIGTFGVGLNRALFKLGRVSHLKTDTGKQRSELILNVDDYLKSQKWELPAEQFQSAGSKGTEIEIRRPTEEIAQQFADQGWVDDLRAEMGKRYGRFIAKKLSIFVNKKPVPNGEIPFREGGPYAGEHKFYKTADGVSIFIQYGQHRDHRFTKEPDHDLARNSSLTNEFGWSILCNDRAIVIADRTSRTGWDRFHTEFYGFVGSVSFVGPDPSFLPWDTTKTDIDLNNHAYQLAMTDMKAFAAKWRALAEERKKPGPLPPAVPPKPKEPPSGPDPGAKTKVPPKKPVIKPVTKPRVSGLRTVLPADVSEQHCFDKHLQLVHEAKRLDLAELTYSGLALIRMLFESSVVTYFDRHKTFGPLKQFAIDRRRNKGVKSGAPPKRIISNTASSGWRRISRH
jgi:hypothetical protein